MSDACAGGFLVEMGALNGECVLRARSCIIWTWVGWWAGLGTRGWGVPLVGLCCWILFRFL
jgi:hypothetical protein